ncbi:DHA2 family efflux MFS transporter permease subunit [Lacticaseibacillus thailandensis]|uniref:Major facilitator superfamily transporter permease n=1 Tax=Lacticaseibacillus thailandensis DSM 22698 = JCM 13996 TaxID=1423810 RepID=A0A0R2C851_9LACO|nr:DHA2 family efflux MFS transporter permease subunit [Lacticaseibacillus thailandensis]KRM87186.1 major facilitator superfamily transporter permease [Lacticaseibacillus thailandensis DSM 22698 = JCM 13996]
MEQVSSTAVNLDKARVDVRHPMLAMVSMWVGAFIGMFSETSLNIALPSLMKSLNVSTATIQWLVTGYMLVIGIVLPFSSFLTKWFTTRQLIIFGLADFIVGAVIAATASVFPVLLVGRLIQGIGTGIILPLMFTVAMSIFPPHKLGAAMGTNALVIMFAPAIGPTLTGIILAKLSWNWIFWVFVPVLAVGLIFAFTSLKNVGNITKPKADFLSMAESVIGFSAIVFGVSSASSRGWGSPVVLVALVIGVIVLGFYAHRQLHLDTPVLNLRAFKIPAFTTGALLVMIDFGIILSAMYLLPMYIQNGLGLVVALTGIIMLPGGVVNALVSALAGRLYDRFGAKAPARIGFIIAFIGAVMLATASTTSSIAYVIAAHVIIMIGAPLAMSPSQTYALNSLTGALSADGSTIMNTMQQIIGAIATAVATSLLGIGEAAYSGHGTAAAFTNGVHYGAYFTVALTIVGFIIALFIKRPAYSKDVNPED